MKKQSDKVISRLLDWYGQEARPLPWRETTDSYAIWVSEVMLQQTQVATALPYYRRFIQRYPRVQDLAATDEETLLAEWSGLGYYSRARNLHKAAQIICRDYSGSFPRDYKKALELPGVGAYTAGAVLSLAYGLPIAAVDGNVRRVLVRYLGICEEVDTMTVTHRLKGWIERQLSRLARVSDSRDGGSNPIADFNQALMELGALICLPSKPHCDRCPISENCTALGEGIVDELPIRRQRKKTSTVHFCSLIVRRGSFYLMHRNREDSFLRDFWEFPRIEGHPDEIALTRSFHRCHGLRIQAGRVERPVRHAITFRRLYFHPVRANIVEPAPSSFDWVNLKESRPFSSYIFKIAESCTAKPQRAQRERKES